MCRAFVRSAVACACLMACEPARSPNGNAVTLDLVGTLTKDTCGAGLGAQSMIRFRAELERSDSIGFWRLGSGPIVQGTFEGEEFEFEFTQERTLAVADIDFGYAGCSVLQTEAVRGEITLSSVDPADGGAGQEESSVDSFVAENTIGVTPRAGFDCAPLTTGAGGPFLTLPCEASYDVVQVHDVDLQP